MTRAGSFVPNENGRLVNTAGYFLQGWVTDTAGNIQNSATRDLLTSLETVNLSQFGQVANSTSNATVNVNLNSNRTVGQSDTTNLTVFDSEGNDYLANGQNRAIYRIPIGTIPAPTQLETVSGNAYRTTATSGDLVLNIAQQGGSGRMQSSALENSTVDIAEQFTDLIITQRAYSAATKIITTGDELLEEIIRVKR
jgi:flagellar hook protein FlgE